MKTRVNVKYFASLWAWEVLFDSNSSQTPSNIYSLTFLETLRTFTLFNLKIRAIMLRKSSKIIVTW